MEMLFVRGDGVILVHMTFPIVLSIPTPLTIPGITPFTYMTSVWQAVSPDVKCNKPIIA